MCIAHALSDARQSCLLRAMASGKKIFADVGRLLQAAEYLADDLAAIRERGAADGFFFLADHQVQAVEGAVGDIAPPRSIAAAAPDPSCQSGSWRRCTCWLGQSGR